MNFKSMVKSKIDRVSILENHIIINNINIKRYS